MAINGKGVYPDVTIESTPEHSLLLVLQSHHLRTLSATRFHEIFGFEPVKDEALQVATDTLSAILDMNNE